MLRDLESTAAESARLTTERQLRRVDKHNNSHREASTAAAAAAAAAVAGDEVSTSYHTTRPAADEDAELSRSWNESASSKNLDNPSLRTLAATFPLNGTFDEQLLQAFSATVERIEELLRQDSSVKATRASDGVGSDKDDGPEERLSLIHI